MITLLHNDWRHCPFCTRQGFRVVLFSHVMTEEAWDQICKWHEKVNQEMWRDVHQPKPAARSDPRPLHGLHDPTLPGR